MVVITLPKRSKSPLRYGQLVSFISAGRQLTGRVVLGIMQGPQSLISSEIPGTVRVKYRCPTRGTLGDIELPISKIKVAKRTEQLELFVLANLEKGETDE